MRTHSIATHCNLVLKTIPVAVKYYTKHGSKVFCAFLDASKAFDKLLLNGLLAKLINRNVTLPLVRVLYNWFSGLSCSVVWNSLIGSPFRVHCEVRQGGVLSPLLFAIYVDDLSVNLGNLVMACILAPCSLVLFYTLMTLHCWLAAAISFSSCNKYGMQWDIRFNPQKSQLACFGGNSPRDNIITLGDIYLS